MAWEHTVHTVKWQVVWGCQKWFLFYPHHSVAAESGKKEALPKSLQINCFFPFPPRWLVVQGRFRTFHRFFLLLVYWSSSRECFANGTQMAIINQTRSGSVAVCFPRDIRTQRDRDTVVRPGHVAPGIPMSKRATGSRRIT